MKLEKGNLVRITDDEVKIAKLKDTEDSTLREKITTQNILNMQVEDPYNPSDYYKENYTKPKAIGFVDFK